MTPAGKKNRRITIQRKTVTTNANGYKTDTWATYKSVMAWIQNMTGREFYNAQKLFSEMNTLFITGYVSGVTTADRILYGTIPYEILSVLDIGEAHNELHIACKKVVVGG
jgi:SPP1 family predicted phage head-tail adaptor